jgi:site-specific recombinase XerD
VLEYFVSETPSFDRSIDVEVSEFTGLEAHINGWLIGYGSPNTRTAYRNDLAHWMQWCCDNSIDPINAERVHVNTWVRTLDGRYRPTTVARRLAAVASFYRYCVEEGIRTDSPVRHIRRPHTTHAAIPTPALTNDELARLLAAATDPIDRALVLLLVVTAVRITEALQMRFDDIETIDGYHTIIVAGKGGRRDRIPLPPVIIDAFHQFSKVTGQDRGPIFVTDGVTWDRHRATRRLRRVARTAGLTRPVTPHQLRTTAITRALAAGANLHDVQDLARHADPRTTRCYDRRHNTLQRSPAHLLAANLPDHLR